MKNEYKLKDSAAIYILAILVPIIVSFALSFVLGFVSVWANVSADALLSNMWVYSLILIISQGSFLAIVLIYNKKKKINTISATTLNKKVSILNYIIVALISVASLFLFLPLVNWFDALIRSWGYSNSGDLPFAINSIPSLIVSLLSLALLPAICEEIIFRGAIYNGIKKDLGVKKAVILSALCFCIMHMSLQQTIYPFLLGIVLALIMYFTGSVRATIFAHFCNNAIVVVSNYLANFSSVSTEEVVFSVNLQTTISALVWFLVGCVVITFGCWILKQLNKKQENLNKESSTQTLSQQLLAEINQPKQEQVVLNTLEKSNLTQENMENSAQEKTLINTDYKLLWLYIGVSLVMWLIENILYFMG